VSRILVVGGVNVDLHLFDVHGSGGQAPLVADHYLAEPGGKGANVARAIARLGVDVSLVARVGDDDFGHLCLETMEADDVDATGVLVTPNTPTGFVAIALEEGLHRSLVYAPGANDMLTWADVEPHVSGLSTADIVVAQAEVPADTLAQLADHMVTSGAEFFVDPTPPERVTAGLLDRTDVITPDQAEAAALVGRQDTSPLWPRLAAEELLAAGARRVVIKLGRRGAILASDDEMVEIPTLPAQAVDETGAGDVFMATLAVCRAEDVDWPEATRIANVASALSVAEQGLYLPDRPSLDAALEYAEKP
jgi:ribokinase